MTTRWILVACAAILGLSSGATTADDIVRVNAIGGLEINRTMTTDGAPHPTKSSTRCVLVLEHYKSPGEYDQGR